MDTTKWKSVLVPIEVYKELIMYQVYEAYQNKELTFSTEPPEKRV